MGFFAFLLLIVAVVCAAALVQWLITRIKPDHPVIIDTIIWVVAVGIILWALVVATGILKHDPQIPHVNLGGLYG